jgi:ABC-type sugar transport system ATPase subunit
VDVGAKQELWSTVRQAAENGAGVIVASSDVEELVDVCDRILVLRQGRIVHELCENPLTVDRLMNRIHDAETAR